MNQGKALFPVLIALSLGHLINDTIQSLLPAIYPIIKQVYNLDFGQIGLLTLTFQLAACIFQPLVGHVNDKKPMPYSIVTGMAFSLAGLLTLAYALSFEALLVGATLVGLGSSIFHPEATRMARQAWYGAGYFCGWRSNGICHRPLTGCIYHRAGRADQYRLVFHDSDDRCHDPCLGLPPFCGGRA